MYKHIMFPVDLHLPPEVRKAADVAAEIAKWQGAKITVVSVTGTDPAQTDSAVYQDLRAIADQLSTNSGGDVAFRNIHSVDAAVEVDGDLAKAADEIGADLIVVGTHAPRITDYIFSSHAGYLAKHASVSVFVVR